MLVNDSTRRFSSRVEHYVRYRPGYPQEVVGLLRRACGLTSRSVVADIASGTGIFTRLLLEQGCRVFGVEPNQEMRAAGERCLRGFDHFTSVAGTAEATSIPDRSADLVTAAQAAHWFDLQRAREEFRRILKDQGWVALLWNERRADGTRFLRDYEQLLARYGTDYQEIRQERTTASIGGFFAPARFHQECFPLVQEFDYPGLEGRLLSSSYAPGPGERGHAPMLEELRQIFDQNQTGGRVAFEYDTKVYYGRLG